MLEETPLKIIIVLNHLQNRTVTTRKLRSELNGTIESKSQYRKLVAFDFDHTVVDLNTDIVVRDLISADKIPREVTKLYKRSGWIPYMQEIFHLLHANGVTRDHIKAAIESIPEVNGVKRLIQQLHDTGDCDVIIISDSNSEFIRYWCTFNDIQHCFAEIHTNQANFDGTGRLLIQPYHNQFSCSLSSVNLCKGDILEKFINRRQHEQQVIYDKIFYIGDGANDICPVLRLGKRDFGMARKNYRMHKEIDSILSDNTNPDNVKHSLDAKLLIWDDGIELAELIFKNF